MTSFKDIKPTLIEVREWITNNNVNPRTKRKIKDSGPTFKVLQTEYKKFKKNGEIDDTPGVTSEPIIDPLLLIELPTIENKPLFRFKHKWDPLTGQRTELETESPVYFDPDTLIHYLYTIRLRGLWINSTIENNDQFTGTYGDAVGNGPNFLIPSRGYHPEIYPFRIPDIDKYKEAGFNPQFVSLTPRLTNEEALELDNLAKTYRGNYKKLYKKKRPSVYLMKVYYDQAIDPDPSIPILDEDLLNNPSDFTTLKLVMNQQAVEQLKVI